MKTPTMLTVKGTICTIVMVVASVTALAQSPIYGIDGARSEVIGVDGFVSIQAPLRGGEFVTKSIVFKGSQLEINYSTSAAGSVHVEILDAKGAPIAGRALTDCHEIAGDELERTVAWKDSTSVRRLAGTPVRLRFVLKDADLFSFRFQ